MSSVPKNLIILEEVDSTNNYAMAMVQKGMAISGDAVFASQQTAGKGRRGKQWQSSPGDNITLTIIVEMQWLSIQRQFQLSVAIALGCLDFFSKYLKENIKIKWPNDIFINDRKAGGILIENVIKGNFWQWAVIGIGLNINQEKFESANFEATSLKNATGKKYHVINLCKELHTLVLERIDRLKEEKFENFLNEYNENLFRKDQLVKLKKGNIIFETKIKGVTASGELVTTDAMERKFEFDEVEWRI